MMRRIARAFVGGRQLQAGVEAGLRGRVALGAAEDEEDGRQHPSLVEEFDRLHAARRSHPPTPSRSTVTAVPAQARPGRVVELQGVAVGATVDEHREQLQPVALLVRHEIFVLQLDRALPLDDRRGRTAHGRDPLGQLRHVAHRRRQAHEADGLRQVDDHLLPNRAPVRVLEEVHLVEHDESEVVQRPRPPVDHVAEDLGRHHDDRGVAIDRVVAGEQPDGVLAVDGGQIAVLLVRQRLDRRGVERSMAGGPSHGDAVFGDHGLTAPGRRRNDDVVTAIERVERVGLEPVDRERVARRQLRPAGRGRSRWSAGAWRRGHSSLGRLRTTSQPTSTATK